MIRKNRFLARLAALAISSSIVAANLAHAGDAPSTTYAQTIQRSGGLSSKGSTAISQGSQASIFGSAVIVNGSITAVAGTGRFVVASIAQVGEGSVVVLKAVGEGVSEAATGAAEFSVRLGSAAVAASGVVVGSTFTVVKETLGWALMAGGKLVAYVVNEEGAAMLRQKPLA